MRTFLWAMGFFVALSADRSMRSRRESRWT